MKNQNASSSSRLVIYYNGNTDLSIKQIAALPYTDVIMAFLVPSGSTTAPSDLKLTGKGAWCVPNELKANIQTLKNNGKNVLISFGGAIGVSSEQYKAYSTDVASLAADLVNNWVAAYGFSGVDIDFEDTSAFQPSGSYNGVDFLSSLTATLASQLPTGQNIITHAPQTPYWGTSWLPKPYVQIWENVSSHISWINNQFYNNPAWSGTPELDIQWYDTIAQTTGAQQLIVGVPVGSASTGSGYLTPSQLILDVITPLQKKYPDFGGVMGWELTNDPDGSWGKEISGALD